MRRRLEKQRVEFFAAASHELKTPITIIKGQLQGMLYQVGRYKDRETYLEVYILGDTQLLQQALDNLLGNAVAYSGAGNQVLIKLWRETK